MNDLKRLRRRLHLTQAAAAKLIGVAPNTWARWERGELQPQQPTQRLIALLPELAAKAPTGGKSHDQ